MSYVNCGNDLIDICAGGHLPTQTLNWLNERAEAVRGTVSGAAGAFFEQARTLYQTIDSSTAMQLLRNIGAKVSDVWNNNSIGYLHEIEKIQTCSLVMQRYVMAEPRLREMYLDQRVEGFDGKYENIHGNVIGKDHYDYRRVMDGIVSMESDDFKVTEYYEDTGDDHQLTFYERVDIINTWNRINYWLDQNQEDPTSIYGNRL